jgi:hypothetical protein
VAIISECFIGNSEAKKKMVLVLKDSEMPQALSGNFAGRKCKKRRQQRNWLGSLTKLTYKIWI